MKKSSRAENLEKRSMGTESHIKIPSIDETAEAILRAKYNLFTSHNNHLKVSFKEYVAGFSREELLGIKTIATSLCDAYMRL
jgi:hypothetical protein